MSNRYAQVTCVACGRLVSLSYRWRMDVIEVKVDSGSLAIPSKVQVIGAAKWISDSVRTFAASNATN